MTVSEKIIVERKKARRLKNALASAGLFPFEFATLMITNRCNLNCGHCWPESGKKGADRPVRTQSLLKLISRFAALDCPALCLTGGEPTTHPEWFRILSHACSRENFREIVFQTNATLIDAELAEKLASLRRDGFVIQVSLEGASSAIHDEIRGPGAFEKAMRGIDALADIGLAPDIRIAFTETSLNFEEFPKLLELAEKKKIPKVTGGTLVRGGRALGGKCLLPPEPRQYIELLELYHRDPAFRKRYNERGSISPIEWHKGRGSGARGRCEFVKKPYVTADGFLHPCIMFQSRSFAARDVFDRDFETVVTEMIPRWMELQAISEKRPASQNECRDCEGRPHCMGGCMGRALAATGDPEAREDRCSLRRAVYRFDFQPGMGSEE